MKNLYNALHRGLMIICSMALIFCSFNVNGQLINNGDFENWPPGCPYNTPPINWDNWSTDLGPDQAGTCAGSVISQSGNSHLNLVWHVTPGLYEGISQQVTGFTIGQSYQLSFYARENDGLYANISPSVLDVYLDNTRIMSTPELTIASIWTNYTVNFTAFANIHTIRFRVNDGSTGTAGAAGVDNVTLTQLTAVYNSLDERLYEIYPNPVMDELKINLYTNEAADLTIFNMVGEMIYENTVVDNTTVSMSHMRRGIYFVELIINNERVVRKVLKH